MRVLGIDPGSVTTGYAICELKGKTPLYIASGILKFKSQDVFVDRIQEIYKQSLLLLQTYKPDEVALESLIFVKSPTALIKLAQARGAMLAALTSENHPIHEYSPNLVKATVTGHGHADKEGVQKWIHLQLGISEFRSHDESDALAVALCHLYHRADGRMPIAKKGTGGAKGKGLAASVAHRIKGMDV